MVSFNRNSSLLNHFAFHILKKLEMVASIWIFPAILESFLSFCRVRVKRAINWQNLRAFLIDVRTSIRSHAFGFSRNAYLPIMWNISRILEVFLPTRFPCVQKNWRNVSRHCVVINSFKKHDNFSILMRTNEREPFAISFWSFWNLVNESY